MSRHTPTPWEVFAGTIVRSSDGRELFKAYVGSAPEASEWTDVDSDKYNEYFRETRANAEYIVHCVNLYSELVAALELVEFALNNTGQVDILDDNHDEPIWEAVTAVLAKTKEMK